MLWSQIVYGHRTASGRIVRLFLSFLDIIRSPVKFSYYLKFHGALTAFCRVIEGTMTSAGHRFHRNSNRTVSTAAGHRTMCENSKELSKISIRIGRCPSGHRPMFYESNCHRWEATCICRSTYWICIDISVVKTKNLNSSIIICFASGAKDE